jgi:thiamine-phosphate pyrophosphorylase
MTERRLRGLYLVTPDMPDTDGLLERVAAALAGRPALLQYRSKQPDIALRREQAQRIAALCRHADVPFIVNDSLELALAAGADGVHLGRDDGDLAAARQALGGGRLLGVSCYDEWERAEAAIAAGADYVAFGAVFASPTKPLAVHAPLELFIRARREFDVALAAIGGITLENAPAAIAAGADLVAVISDVFDAPDPCARASAYRALFDARGTSPLNRPQESQPT